MELACPFEKSAYLLRTKPLQKPEDNILQDKKPPKSFVTFPLTNNFEWYFTLPIL